MFISLWGGNIFDHLPVSLSLFCLFISLSHNFISSLINSMVICLRGIYMVTFLFVDLPVVYSSLFASFSPPSSLSYLLPTPTHSPTLFVTRLISAVVWKVRDKYIKQENYQKLNTRTAAIHFHSLLSLSFLCNFEVIIMALEKVRVCFF